MLISVRNFQAKHQSLPLRCAMNHMGIVRGDIIVTCGVEAKEERARHGKGQYPHGCNHEGHAPTGALSCAMLVVNWHGHCSVPAKESGEKTDMMRRDGGNHSKTR